MADPITFLASFPPIQSAIKIGDTGMRLQLDVPESEMAAAVQLIALRDVVLRVTVEPQETVTIGTTTPRRGAAKRRK